MQQCPETTSNLTRPAGIARRSFDDNRCPRFRQLRYSTAAEVLNKSACISTLSATVPSLPGRPSSIPRNWNPRYRPHLGCETRGIHHPAKGVCLCATARAFDGLGGDLRDLRGPSPALPGMACAVENGPLVPKGGACACRRRGRTKVAHKVVGGHLVVCVKGGRGFSGVRALPKHYLGLLSTSGIG